MEYGFCEFFDKDMPRMESFFKNGNANNVLGLRKMNVRISNMLFPECSTLMPTILYFYYLHAIYHVLFEKDKKEPEEGKINKYEKALSKVIIAFQRANKYDTKGLFDTARNRAYHWYKTTFRYMHFKDKNWIPNQGCKPQYEKLKETWRYKFVCAFITNDYVNKKIEELNNDDYIIQNVDSVINDIASKMNGNDKNEDKIRQVKERLDRLDEIEKMDFVRRLLADDYDPQKTNRISKYSYMSNIIMDIIGVTTVKSNSKIYKEDYDSLDNYMKYKKISYPFYLSDNPLPPFRLKSPFVIGQAKKLSESEIEYGVNVAKGGNGRDNSRYMYDNMKLSQSYSFLQGIAKKVYNYILFCNDENKKKEIETQLYELLECYLSMMDNTKTLKKDVLKWKWKDTSPFFKIFCGVDEDLKGIFEFISSIGTIIPDEIREDFTSEEWFENVKQIVINRENEIMGSDALLNSGFVPDKPFADYIDTFRWEYRPEELYNMQDDGEEEMTDISIDNEKNTKEEYVSKPHNMCAQYFIYELFYEKPHEKVVSIIP